MVIGLSSLTCVLEEGQLKEWLESDTISRLTIVAAIESFAPGTGSQIALLPPENATGNFTKIVQRVPAKIVLDDHDPLIARLRPGLSAETVIDTRDRPNKPLSKPIQLGALKVQ